MSSSDVPECSTEDTQQVRIPTIREAPGQTRRYIRDLIADHVPAHQGQGTTNSVDHFIIASTAVPDALRDLPHIARLLSARDDLDRQLAYADFGDSASVDIWDARQVIDEDIAAYVEEYMAIQGDGGFACSYDNCRSSQNRLPSTPASDTESSSDDSSHVNDILESCSETDALSTAADEHINRYSIALDTTTWEQGESGSRS